MEIGSFCASFTISLSGGAGVAETFDFDCPRTCGLSSASSDISPNGCLRKEDDDEVKDIVDGCSMHADVSAESVSSDGAAKDKTVS
jgi:hypothetical protein